MLICLTVIFRLSISFSVGDDFSATLKSSEVSNRPSVTFLIISFLFLQIFTSTFFPTSVRATIIGRQLITSLPESMGYPDMTAHWESQLEAISQRQMNYAQFMQPMTQDLSQLIGEVSNVEFKGLQGLGKSAFGKRKPSGKKKFSPKKK